jgi:hypothetical protein
VKALTGIAIVAAGALAAASGAAAAGNHGKLGSTVTVIGQTHEVVAVTATKIEDPVLAYGAASGTRNIGVVFTVKNVGKVKYDDSPNALVSTADGQISGGEITGGGPCNTPGDVKLAPGQQKTFCVLFAVRKTGKLTFVQYETDGGYGTPAVFAVK